MEHVDGNTWVSVGALLIAALSLWNRVFSGRDRIVDERMATMQKNFIEALEKQDGKFNERMRGMSDAWTRANTETRQTMYTQFNRASAISDQNATKIGKLELDMIEKFSQYPNKTDLRETLEDALQPLRDNQDKIGNLMQEVLRSGVLRDNRDRARDDQNKR